jgi:ATP-binding cassette subfamily B protein
MTLVNFTEQYQNGVTGFERFLEILAEKPEADSEGAVDIGRAEGHIRFQSVTSAYDEGSEIIRGIDLDIEKGKTYALVGPSGGGKTTICHLIPGFYEINGGEISLDGRDIRSITKSSLRRNIGIVQQDVYLFNSSIRDNILYGRLDATEEEVIEAARRANIHDYIMTLPEGYETNIGERGVKLSGGQKQRLSIARVFLKNPPILILDEATSALDNKTQKQVSEALDRLHCTRIVIAHRLSTIRNCDRILLIDDGGIAEEGTYEELIARGGAFAELVERQRLDT